MSLTLRGFRGFARLFTQPKGQKNLGSVCKVLVPCLSFQNMSTATRTETINSNLQLRFSSKKPSLVLPGNPGPDALEQGVAGHGSPVHGSSGRNPGHATYTSAVEARTNPLVLIFSWMKAKEAHMERFHDFYLDLGFDVLTVRTHPMQLAFPAAKGSQLVAQMVLDFLVGNPNYDRLAVHAFSVGGYQVGEILVRMRKGGSKYLDLVPRFKAQVYDSIVDYMGIPTGFPTALTKSIVLRKVLEIIIRVQGVVLYPFSLVHHKAASRAFHDSLLTCPALMINSKRDTVISLEDNIRVGDLWRKKGTDVTLCTFDDSKHVQHMGMYPEEYVTEVLRLLRKAQLVA